MTNRFARRLPTSTRRHSPSISMLFACAISSKESPTRPLTVVFCPEGETKTISMVLAFAFAAEKCLLRSAERFIAGATSPARQIAAGTARTRRDRKWKTGRIFGPIFRGFPRGLECFSEGHKVGHKVTQGHNTAAKHAGGRMKRKTFDKGS